MKRLKYGKALLCSVFILLSLVLSVGFAQLPLPNGIFPQLRRRLEQVHMTQKVHILLIGIDSNNKAHISYMLTYASVAGIPGIFTIFLIPLAHGLKKLRPTVFK